MTLAFGLLAALFCGLVIAYRYAPDFNELSQAKARDWWMLAFMLPVIVSGFLLDPDLEGRGSMLVTFVLVPSLLLAHMLLGVHLDRDVPKWAHATVAAVLLGISLSSKQAWSCSFSLLAFGCIVYLFGPIERRSAGHVWLAGFGALALTLPKALA